MNPKIVFCLVLIIFSTVDAQVAEWMQCGGVDFKGSTKCAPGMFTCLFVSINQSKNLLNYIF